jgi:hypothetical protein
MAAIKGRHAANVPRRRRLRDLGEEALDEIQPGDAGRGEDGNETADAPGVTFSPWDA